MFLSTLFCYNLNRGLEQERERSRERRGKVACWMNVMLMRTVVSCSPATLQMRNSKSNLYRCICNMAGEVHKDSGSNIAAMYKQLLFPSVFIFSMNKLVKNIYINRTHFYYFQLFPISLIISIITVRSKRWSRKIPNFPPLKQVRVYKNTYKPWCFQHVLILRIMNYGLIHHCVHGWI